MKVGNSKCVENKSATIIRFPERLVLSIQHGSKPNNNNDEVFSNSRPMTLLNIMYLYVSKYLYAIRRHLTLFSR